MLHRLKLDSVVFGFGWGFSESEILFRLQVSNLSFKIPKFICEIHVNRTVQPSYTGLNKMDFETVKKISELSKGFQICRKEIYNRFIKPNASKTVSDE